MTAAIDHLVVGAATLEQGVQWCEQVLGITPGPGGRHGFMGTHNRLFSISGAGHEQAYFEIIAVDPDAPPPGRTRWFDLDDAPLRAALAQGPRLLHWVLRCEDLAGAVQDWQALGIARGEILAAGRETPQGMLRWRITVREDGRRLMDGALPTLIAWDGPHPAQAMPSSGVTLRALRLAGPQPGALAQALRGVGLSGVEVAPQPAAQGLLEAVLDTPRGEVTLRSDGATAPDARPDTPDRPKTS